MRCYSINGASVDGSTGSVWNLTTNAGGSSYRAGVYEFNAGLASAPSGTDIEISFAIVRSTTAGITGTSVTPLKLNTSDVAADTLVTVAHTAGAPGYTSVLMDLRVNQKDLYRWWCSNVRYELVTLSSTNNGIAMLLLSSTTGRSWASTVFFRE